METRIEVVGAVIVRDGLVFCARRGPGGEDAGRWEFPGGKIEPGETPEAALGREVAEELGCEITVGELIVSTPHSRILLSTYFCALAAEGAQNDETEPKLTEHVDACWLAPAELLTLDWAPADLPTVRRILADLERSQLPIDLAEPR